MKRTILIFISLLMILSGCKSSSLQAYDFTSISLGFDTAISFRAYCHNEEEFNQYKEVLIKRYQEYDQIFSYYDEYPNNLYHLNHHAGSEVKVHPEIISLLKEAKEYQQLTHSQFDVTIGAMLSIWHQYREQAELLEIYQIPNDDELLKVKEHRGFENIVINEEKSTVLIKDTKMSLDFGGIAKGYATQQIANQLHEMGLQHGFINAGGNVVIIGPKADNSPIRVGLQIPDASKMQTNSLLSIAIDQPMAFVTSGNYQRYYEVDGQKYHHIIDPDTNMPATHFDSVTIITPDSTLADALSTALFNMSLTEGVDLLKTMKQQGISIDVIWVSKEPLQKMDSLYEMKSEGYHILYTDTLHEYIVQ